RRAVRGSDEAAEELNRLAWLIDRRRETPDEGPDAVRRAELQADLRAERRLAERAERERQERVSSLQALREGISRDEALVAAAQPGPGGLGPAGGGGAARRHAADAG